jgi:hypothetical protein
MKLKEGMVVTRDETAEIESSAGQIKVMAAWKYLLSQ